MVRRVVVAVVFSLSEALEVLRKSLETAVAWPVRTGVVLPDGVRCLTIAGLTDRVGMLDVLYIAVPLYLPLAGVR